ncbi:GumK N-terminal domain-containing glycosyltransferase [Azonexus fungiphilus]|uniref:GumK N-terminal domain-containing glycosyltransferase n=1 Tax=Azonexus fungiphilus TaxID=146940 RepID=UPI00156A761D|nr:hypothetical protein [Azonexus fungiphilus]NHC07551.1 hypothetical protein [Azonexus fungiphilus]
MKFLIISKHDFRSLRKANIHFLATEFRSYGEVRFFSIGLSFLSRFNGDPRGNLGHLANKVEISDGVECYLQKNLLHPFRIRYGFLRMFERALFSILSGFNSVVLDRWIIDSDYVVLESGLPISVLPRIYRLKPDAKVVYIASDDLDTIGCSVVLSDILDKFKSQFECIRLPSKTMIKKFEGLKNVFFVPHGFKSIPHEDLVNPYPPGTVNFVSVGSMLFDRSFFDIATEAFPDINFHIIGNCGDLSSMASRGNVFYYGEMAYKDTLAYIKYANSGVAPYNMTPQDYYLSDTSLKLMQYDYFRLPSICPFEACGGRQNRFGYKVGDRASIEEAINRALNFNVDFETKFLSWADVAKRILYPRNYIDTTI